MNSFRIELLIVLMLFSFLGKGVSQKDSTYTSADKLEAILKVKDGNIFLRWAPTTPGLWLKMQRAEIVIQKQSWEPGKFDTDLPLRTISDTMRVWSQTAFEELPTQDQENEHLMLAGYCMHAPYESIREEKLSLESIINREEELTNRFSSALFAAERDRLAAESLAMRFKDDNADLHQNHAYHIIMITEDKKIFQAFAFYNVNINYEFTPEISNYSEEESAVVLSWDKATHTAHYSAYWIERSNDNKSFERLNDIPYVHAFDSKLKSENDDLVFIDSVTNYQPYYYRIIGLDAFGDESDPSPSIKLLGRDKTAPSSIDRGTAEMHLDQNMKIKWTHSPTELDIDGYYIKKSALREGPFQYISPLIQNSERSFIDSYPNYIGTNFYQVCSVDTAKNEACSYPIYGLIRDTIPPIKPDGLIGSIDSSGIVKLQWNAGKELDLRGYNVYFANKWNRVFTILNQKPVLSNQYIDTINLNSLTEDIYYRIVAVDVRDNMSTFSDMVQLFKPDTIPPGPAIFIDYLAKNDSIYLSWAPSSSKDVVSHTLYRAIGKSSLQKVKTFEDKIGTYIDSNLETGLKYTYRIIATDDSGLESENVADISVKSPSTKDNPTLVLIPERTDDGIQLICNVQNMDFGAGKLVVYKQKKEGPFITWKSIQLSESSIQLPLPESKENKYKGRIIFNSGHKSKYSNIVELD